MAALRARLAESIEFQAAVLNYQDTLVSESSSAEPLATCPEGHAVASLQPLLVAAKDRPTRVLKAAETPPSTVHCSECHLFSNFMPMWTSSVH